MLLLPSPLRRAVQLGIDEVATDPERPLRQKRYRTPLRDERVAAWLGSSLGTLFTICFVTGLFSHIQQHPVSWLPVPSRPVGLYRVTQGVHVAAGIASLPVLVAKLWTVWPRVLSFPPFRRAGDVVERVEVLALIGGGIFQVFSGIANTAQWYPWKFSFTVAHFWVSWIVMGGIAAHLGAKWYVARRAVRPRSRRPAITEADTSLGASAEAAGHPGLSRRGLLGTVAAASGALTFFTVGETWPLLRRFAVLAPRRPADRPVNQSAAAAGVLRTVTAADFAFSLTIEGRNVATRTVTLEQLLAMPQHDPELPIACVEGWSYSARWSGPRLRDVMALVDAPGDAGVYVHSMQRHSIYSTAFVNHYQAHDADTILALRLEGAELSPDHGYPVRLIGPDRPGVTQTKWVERIEVV